MNFQIDRRGCHAARDYQEPPGENQTTSKPIELWENQVLWDSLAKSSYAPL